MIPANSLLLGDCLGYLPEIEDESVDCVLADLPYGTTKARWDHPIDLEKLWPEYKRVIKPNGAILLFSQTPFDKKLGVSNLKWLRYEWIWEKSNATGFLNARRMPLKAHETILVFYRRLPYYNPQKTNGHRPVNAYKRLAANQNKSQIYGNVREDSEGGGETDRFPRDVLRYPSDKQKRMRDGTIFPVQKPVALCEYLIKTYTRPGELVLDNCCGSGSTLLAARNMGRNFIGMELDDQPYELAEERLSVV